MIIVYYKKHLINSKYSKYSKYKVEIQNPKFEIIREIEI